HVEGHHQPELGAERRGGCALVPGGERTAEVDRQRAGLEIGSRSSGKTEYPLGQISDVGKSDHDQLKARRRSRAYREAGNSGSTPGYRRRASGTHHALRNGLQGDGPGGGSSLKRGASGIAGEYRLSGVRRNREIDRPSSSFKLDCRVIGRTREHQNHTA